MATAKPDTAKSRTKRAETHKLDNREPADGLSERAKEDGKGRLALSLNLFWRSFTLIALLVALSVCAWIFTVDQLDFEPRARQTAHTISSLVNLSRAAVLRSEGQNRAAVFRSIADEEGLYVRQRRPIDQWVDFGVDGFTRRVVEEVKQRLGEDTVVASEVNGVGSLWVGFNIDSSTFWLQAPLARVQVAKTEHWPLWLAGTLLLNVLLVIGLAMMVNRPLKELSFAASRIGEGEFDSNLDESNITNEIRVVNIGFNRMARELAKVEQERAVMLAGISHDLRTPLARLRLEVEISVGDDDARKNMADDINQLDSIIDKFMDYARPDGNKTTTVNLVDVILKEAASFRDRSQIRIAVRLPEALYVKGDNVELGRVFTNLFENSRRYGRTNETGIAMVKVSHVEAGDTVIVTVRDSGPGVPPEKLPHLTTPFYRGDAARTAATGAGLGLAVVKKALQRIDGELELSNAVDGGLVAHIRLKKA